jgi:hypothetical protein
MARAVDRGAAVVHRSMVDRGQGGERRGQVPRWTGRAGQQAAVHGRPRTGASEAGRRGRPAAAVRHGRGPELAGTAFRRTGERAEGTRGVCLTR